ncbi:hypothetical protein D3C86_1576630 [compost metagenome]
MCCAAFREIVEAGPFGFRLQITCPVPDDILCGERLAIVEFHVLAKLESIDQAVRRDIDGFGEKRLHLAGIVITDEAFDDVQDNPVRIAVAVHTRIVAAQIGALRDGDIAGRRDIGGHEQGNACKKKFFHCSTLFVVIDCE